MTDKKPQLHQSDLGTFSRCQMQFMFRNGERFGIGPENLIQPPGIAAAVGTATHKGVERNLTSMVCAGTPAPLGEVQEAARDALSNEWDGGLMLLDEEAENLNKTRGDATDTAVNLATLHYCDVAPSLAPIDVEKKFVIVRADRDFDLSGQIDVVESTNVLRDTKTSGKSPAHDAAISPQMAMYSLNHVVETGNLPTMVALDYLVKTKTPKWVPRYAAPTNEWIKRLLDRTDRVWEIIASWREGKATPSPANPDDWMCTKKWCGYTNKCPFWSGR